MSADSTTEEWARNMTSRLMKGSGFQFSGRLPLIMSLVLFRGNKRGGQCVKRSLLTKINVHTT